MSPSAVRLIPLILDEFEAQQRSLEDIADNITKESQRWQVRAKPMVVLDANMLLEPSQSIEDVDFKQLLQCAMDLRLVVPIVVLHELDRLKRQGNSTTAQQARAAIRWLASVLPQEVDHRSDLLNKPPHVTIETYVHEGPSRPPDADALIIEVCQDITAMSDAPTTLVTRDLSMSLRASAAGVDFAYVEGDADGLRVVRRRG